MNAMLEAIKRKRSKLVDKSKWEDDGLAPERSMTENMPEGDPNSSFGKSDDDEILKLLNGLDGDGIAKSMSKEEIEMPLKGGGKIEIEQPESKEDEMLDSLLNEDDLKRDPNANTLKGKIAKMLMMKKKKEI